jgi:hypothetical protein
LPSSPHHRALPMEVLEARRSVHNILIRMQSGPEIRQF